MSILGSKSDKAKKISQEANGLFTQIQEKFDKSTELASTVKANNDAKIKELLAENTQMETVILENNIVSNNIEKIRTAPISVEEDLEKESSTK